MWTIYLLLSHLSKSQSIFQSTWIASGYCQGPPDTMFLYDATNSSASGVYTFFYEEAEGIMNLCGDDTIPLQKGCCRQSLDTELSAGYESMHQNEIESEITTDDFMVDAIGAVYCKMKMSQNIESSLSSYHEAFFLRDGTCKEGGIICTTEGMLEIYSELDCTGSLESFVVSSSPVSVDSATLGQIEVSSLFISQGTVTMLWRTGYPDYLLVPQFDQPLEYVACILYSLSFIICIVTCLIYGRKFYKSRNVTYLLFNLGQLSWLLWLILEVCLAYLEFPDMISVDLCMEFAGILFNSSTLLSVFNMARMMLRFSFVDIERQIKATWITFIAISIINVGLAGSRYADYYREKEDWLWRWNTHGVPFWIAFMFIFDVLSFFYISWLAFRSKCITLELPLVAGTLKITKQTPTVGLAMIFQILNTLFYTILIVIQNYTHILGNDWNWLSFQSVIAFTFVTHSLLICLFLEGIVNLTQLRKLPTSIIPKVLPVSGPKSDPITSTDSHTPKTVQMQV